MTQTMHLFTEAVTPKEFVALFRALPLGAKIESDASWAWTRVEGGAAMGADFVPFEDLEEEAALMDYPVWFDSADKNVLGLEGLLGRLHLAASNPVCQALTEAMIDSPATLQEYLITVLQSNGTFRD